METTFLTVFRSNPAPRQVGHGEAITSPLPLHVGHGPDCIIEPKIVCRTWRTSPRPLQVWQRCGLVPGAAPLPLPAPEPVGVDPGDMAERLADYAERFEREIAAVVAEERYVQVIHPWRGNPSGPQGEPALAWREPGDKGKQGGPIISRRQLLSDVVMVQLKDRQWLSYRDVAEVDGSPVRDRTDRVRDLLPG